MFQEPGTITKKIWKFRQLAQNNYQEDMEMPTISPEQLPVRYGNATRLFNDDNVCIAHVYESFSRNGWSPIKVT